VSGFWNGLDAALDAVADEGASLQTKHERLTRAFSAGTKRRASDEQLVSVAPALVAAGHRDGARPNGWAGETSLAAQWMNAH
jgi:hypothetical protein